MTYPPDRPLPGPDGVWREVDPVRLSLRAAGDYIWTDDKTDRLRGELQSLFNRESVDNALNTPDFILADLVVQQLQAYRQAQRAIYHHEGRPW